MADFFLGCAFLALMHKEFPARKAMKCFTGVERPAISFLWQTFGTKKSNLKLFFDKTSNRQHMVQVYLLNGVCQRKGNCKRGELGRSWSTHDWNAKLRRKNPVLLYKLNRRVKNVRVALDKYANANSKLVLVPALEDNFTDEAARILIEEIRKEWPYEIVRNPVGNNPHKALAGADHLELHGSKAPLGGHVLYASLDGEDIEFEHRAPTVEPAIPLGAVRKYVQRAKSKNCIAVFLWAGLWQGLRGDSGGALPPRERQPQVSDEDIREVNNILRENDQ